MVTQRTLAGICIISLGILLSPFLPFAYLPLFPLSAVFLGSPGIALLFSVLVDSFLVPGDVPFWISLTLYTLAFIPICAYARYNVVL